VKSWKTSTLGEIFAIARGGSPRPIDDYITEDPNGVNWVMISDATESGKFINSTKKRIRAEGVKRSRMVQPGDFLLTNSMSFGRPYIMNTSGCIHDGWLVFSPQNKNASPDFFYHLLGSDFVFAEFERRAAGATVKNLNIDLVKTVEVPLPPLAEQRRIAEVLDKAEALRAKRRAALAQLDSLTQSLFLDLFGDPKDNPKGLQLAPLIEICSPKQWPTISTAELTETGFPVFGANGLIGYYPEYNHEESTVLITCRGATCGTINISPPKCYVTGNAMALDNPDPKRVTIEWLAAVLKMRSMADTISGSAQPQITRQNLQHVRLPLPPLDLQREFARRVAAVEKLKTAQRAALAELDALFASLQHRAFRGEL
jgi:type I restriction enzyme S subunit